jgi:nucleoid DNA-binding protein
MVIAVGQSAVDFPANLSMNSLAVRNGTGHSMTKKEIVKTISEQIGLTQLKTKEIVQKTFDAIIDTLVTEQRIELRNFGVFEVKKRAARKARNPRTGEKVFVEEKYVVTFKPGKEMEERVGQLEKQENARRAAAVSENRDLADQSPAPIGGQNSNNSTSETNEH